MRIKFTDRFLRDLDRLRDLRGRDFDLESLYWAINIMAAGDSLPDAFRDHALRGPLKGFREFHIGTDDLVIYRRQADVIVFRRAGTHRNLFGKA